jgi:LmbE family N-acetylglucosaminyl deacetylase
MAITAHPDDEVINFGGTLRLYADRGVDTSVLCLTPGQAASHRGNAKNDLELAAIRRKEFAASCEILKVKKAIVLDYPDGHLHRQDLYRVVSDLTLCIRQIRPDVILTFGPEGGATAHMDHSMASIYATLAYHWAGRENRYPDQLTNGITPQVTQKLYYSTADFILPGYEAVSAAPGNVSVDVSKYFDTKMAAFKAHTTQAPILPMIEKNIGELGKIETFHLAAAVKSAAVSKDLM